MVRNSSSRAVKGNLPIHNFSVVVFSNTRNQPASKLGQKTPWAPRAAYFEGSLMLSKTVSFKAFDVWPLLDKGIEVA